MQATMALAKNSVESVKLVEVPSPSASVIGLRYRGDACCPSTRMLLHNRANFKNSAAPARFMYYNDGAWVDFPEEVLGEVKSAFADHRPVLEHRVFGSDHLFDFLRMADVEFGSGRQRSISWIDEKGKCFFPKEFFGSAWGRDDDAGDPKIEVQIKIHCDSLLKRKREEKSKGVHEEEEVSSTNEGSKRQRLVSDNVASSTWPNAILVNEGNWAHSLARNYFMLGMRTVDPGAVVTAIHQCTHGRGLAEARGGSANTVYAWYGASRKGLESVLVCGFGPPSQVSGCARDYHGIGVYLSPVGLPHLSAQLSEVDDKGEKHLLLCRVLLDNVEKVKAGSQQFHHCSPTFNTGSDDPKNPKWFVVWTSRMSRYITPLCVLSFKPSNHGQVRGRPPVQRVRCSLGMLIYKLKTSLPPSKCQEVGSLRDAYKAGKLSKDIFLKQLQRVAGDQVYFSVVREICGF